MLERIRIVMVRSRSPGNVGSAARAMMNFGLSRLYLAGLPEFEDPDYFETESRKLAWRAGAVLDAARHVETMEEALEGTRLVLGTAPRELRGARSLTPRKAAAELVEVAARGDEVALVFGGEANGLDNEELSRLAGVVRIPTGEAYQDLNLAQSVVVCAYELFLAAGRPTEPTAPEDPEDAPLAFEEEQALFESARELLAEAGYLKEAGHALTDELRRLLARRRVTRREANLLRGMIRQLGWAVRN